MDFNEQKVKMCKISFTSFDIYFSQEDVIIEI